MSEKKDDADKSEEPTPKKLEKAREDGNVSISKEISSVLLLVTSIMALVAGGEQISEHMFSLFGFFFQNADARIDDMGDALEYLESAMEYGLGMIMPTMTVLMIVALLVNLIQTQFAFSQKAYSFKGSKLNPLKGLKKIVSPRSFVELAKGFSKLGIVGVVIHHTVRNDVNDFLAYAVTPLGYAMSETGSYMLMFVTRIMAALFLLSIIDALYQRFQHRKELRMTKQEVKDEYKQMEGDPHIKGKRRQFGMRLRMQKRLDHAVLASDVVVTNPTHYAVALRYDPENNQAPIVMAKGQRNKALKIKELARHYGIPIVENKPVARALFATAQEDAYIPVDLFRAVAEILAYVYKLKNKKAG
jgi:flagellar biosynthesis protein FlhB